MALHNRENDRVHGLQDSRIMQNQPPANEASLTVGEESLADTDEPPDERKITRSRSPSHLPLLQTSNFNKTRPMQKTERHQSLLTQALVTSSSEDHDEETARPLTSISRATSTASTWSNASAASLTSDGGITSPGTRSSSPSPPLPPSGFHVMAPLFRKNFTTQPVAIRQDTVNEPLSPLQKPEPNETTVEAGLGRKRCISFACGNNQAKPAMPEQKPVEAQPADPPKRKCTIKFACGNQTAGKASPPLDPPAEPQAPEPAKRQCTIKFAACLPKPSEGTLKSRPIRAVSPAPLPRKIASSPKTSRSHRDSDSTIRNDSPKSFRKSASGLRCFSNNIELGRTEATRFHEFASSEEEVDEWTEESTVHRNQLTVNDTLRVENGLRQLGEEVEEEALDEDEEDEDEDVDDEEEDDEEEATRSYYDDVSSEGFQTDDEEGFAVSDDDSGSDSEYGWWHPGAGRSTAATSTDQLDHHHIRPRSRRSPSESSIGSPASSSGFTRVHDILKRKARSKRKPIRIRDRSPELPDSTDFVCGTLDEDRPLEDAYMSCLERRRAAKHKAKPQDIDPTFPESDPEMDEEDEEDEMDGIIEESDQHMFMHGQLDNIDGDRDVRGRKRRSPHLSPRRLRSPPPPAKRAILHSPPPIKRVPTSHRSPPPPAKRTTCIRSPPTGRLFGQSPKRRGSPPHHVRLRSPPPTRRTSFQGVAALQQQREMPHPSPAFARRPPPTVAASLPRTPIVANPDNSSESNDERGTENDMHSRGAIDIKAGLEKKRQRRREKMYLKHCRKAGKDKNQRKPGKGAERMREMGLELAAYRGHGTGRVTQQDVHMLSY